MTDVSLNGHAYQTAGYRRLQLGLAGWHSGSVHGSTEQPSTVRVLRQDDKHPTARW